MAKKTPPKSHHHKHVFWILFASLLTIVLIGGNMFLLLSIPAAVSERNRLVQFLIEDRKLMGKTASTQASMVYVTEESEPHIWFDGKLYTSSYEYVPSDGKNIAKKALVEFPAGTRVVSARTSDDGTLVVFSMATDVTTKFVTGQTSPAGYTAQVTSVFAYNTQTKKVDQLFSSDKLGEFPYAYPSKISKDNKYIAFENTNCLDCDTGHPVTFVYDLNNHVLKDVGLITAFDWLENGNFQYKAYVEKECKPEDFGEGGGCFKDPSTLPFKKGSWK